jgi:hypothetical protein
MIRIIAFMLFTVGLLSVGCSQVNDCDCKTTDKDGKEVTNTHYDYEGNCSELNEEGWTCTNAQ